MSSKDSFESEKPEGKPFERRASATKGNDIFSGALMYLLQNEVGKNWEGGGFTNYPHDRGKATKWGVTMKTLAAYRGRLTTVEDVRLLKLEEATEIYRELFWERLSLDLVKRPQIAIALLDTAVLYGGMVAVFNAQIACQRVGYSIKVDGIIGPKTLEALNSARVKSWISTFQDCIHKRITRIVSRNPDNKIWEEGWRNRVKRLGTLV